MGEVKVVKTISRALSQSHVGFALFGFFLVILTYFTVFEQFSTRPLMVILRTSPAVSAQMNPKEQETDALKKDDGIKLEEKPTPAVDFHGEEDNKNTENDRRIEDHENHKEPEDAEKKDGVDSKQFGHEPEKKEENDSKQFGGGTEHPNQQPEKKDETEVKQFGGGTENRQRPPQNKPLCDTADPRSDVCDMEGDIRTHGISSSILFVPPYPVSNPEPHEWKIKPYSRKFMNGIKEVSVKQLHGPQEAPACSVRQSIPAVVFYLGGLTGNYWHDFTDVIIPLFIEARQFDGEVQFLITNIQGWWIGKYHMILKQLSRYDIIDLDKDLQIRCYPRMIVGIRSHKEFSIEPSRAPNGVSMVDFRKFMRIAYSLDRDYPIKLRENVGSKKPRLLLIARGLSRRFTNVEEIVKSAERLGFEVVVVDAKFNVNIAEFAKVVNSCDVMVGVHGAGLTNCVFLPTNAVMIQVVPYGKLEHMAKIDFGEPAIDMQLKYVEYSISAEESTLMDMFGKDHPIIKDPMAIHRSGWEKVGEFYLGKQDIKLDVNRFAPTLLKAIDLLKE
uniref:Glycosyltransferase 61 catalytic domain-containing protein n=1 Tax=Ananas comosus var. bracteatus TaxID=296719 RepID=A0A6V7QI10_ANACO|nr:unnamed protein product [Ananas comosus var. bracteatus]